MRTAGLIGGAETSATGAPLETIDRIRGTDAAALERLFDGGLKNPAVVTGVITEWPAFDRWSMQQFAQDYGDLLGLIPVSFAERNLGKAAKLRDFLEGMDVPLEDIPGFWVNENQIPCQEDPGTDGQGWSFTWRPFKKFPEMLDEIGAFPEEFGNLVPDLPPDLLKMLQWILSTDLRSIYISRRGTVTPFHFDFHDTISSLSQFEGRKLVSVVEPGDLTFSEIAGFDPEQPDYEAFPAMQGRTVHSAVLERGETIVIPPNWWHFVRSLDHTITFSYNFTTRHNLGGFIRGVLGDLMDREHHEFVAKATRTLISDKIGKSCKDD